MAKNQSTDEFNPVRALQKFAVSAFVVLSFLAYVVHEQLANANAAAGALAPGASPPSSDPLQNTPQQNTPQQAPSSPQTAQGTSPTPAAQSAYKDGTYTGPSVNAFWGQVQVRAVIQNGKITNVQFLQYPSDRRTSVRINTTVIPYLQSEAVQAQSANVDFISGATLTSEAFMQSLQTALSAAQGGA